LFKGNDFSRTDLIPAWPNPEPRPKPPWLPDQ
jgi:hypothetical protein